MLDRLIDLAVHRRTATLLFTLALFAGGLYTYFNLPIEAYPDVTNLQVNIITLFPGQASEEVERQVTIPLERGLSALPKAIDLRSVSVFGLSYIIVTFDDEVDMYFARQVVTERLRQVDLPDGVVSVLGPQITPLGEVYQFTVDGGGNHPRNSARSWTGRSSRSSSRFPASPISSHRAGSGKKSTSWWAPTGSRRTASRSPPCTRPSLG